MQSLIRLGSVQYNLGNGFIRRVGKVKQLLGCSNRTVKYLKCLPVETAEATPCTKFLFTGMGVGKKLTWKRRYKKTEKFFAQNRNLKTN